MLNRKLLRDLLAGKWQFLAIAAMVMLGVAFFNAAYAAYVNLDASYTKSYEALDFEDFSIRFNSAPQSAVERIRRLPGVAAVEGRLVEDVALEIPGADGGKRLIGRLIGMPAHRELTVNRLRLVSGSPLTRLSRKEVLLEAGFAKFHNLQPGGEVEAVRGSSKVRLKIAGIVQSPEYLYVVRSKQELMAMPDTFGVMFVPESILGPLVGKPGAINAIHVRVAGDELRQSAMARSKAVLATYRPDEPVPREDQPSYQMLVQDVEGFRVYAVLFPAFFLSVAAAAVYTLLMRVVHQQRPVIGLLRSLGFSRWAVVWHYLASALLLGLLGSIGGTLGGIWMADWTSLSYMSMLQVPYPEVVPRPIVLLSGVIIGMATCGVAAILPAYSTAGIQPGEAMRPLTPTFGSGSVRADRLFPHLRLLWRIPLRNIFRQPKRTLSTLFGIVAGLALMMTAKGLLDSSEIAMDEVVSGSYRYDYRVDFVGAQSSGVINRIRSWPGVVRAEGVLEIPIEIERKGKTFSALLSGQEQASALHELPHPEGGRIAVTREGLIVGTSIQRKLELEVGDFVELSLPAELTEEKPRRRAVQVAGFTNEAMATVAYLPRTEVWRLFRSELALPPNAISAVTVLVDPVQAPEVRHRLEDLPHSGSVLSVADIRSMIERMMQTMRVFIWIMQLFGVALALAMVFNMVTINVLERTAEIATLRTLGVTRSQVAWMIRLENLLIALTGIAIGLPFGRLFIGWFWQAAQTPEQQELFTFQVALKPETYVMSAIAILIAVLVSQIPATRMLSSLDLARAAKERSS